MLSRPPQALRREAETQRSRLLAATERMQKGTDKIRAARQTALETESIGANIMADLEAQRQTMELSRATLGFASSGLDRSRKILAGMGRRAKMNKVLMCVIILALLVMIALILWLNFFYSPSSVPSPPPPPPPRLQ